LIGRLARLVHASDFILAPRQRPIPRKNSRGGTPANGRWAGAAETHDPAAGRSNTAKGQIPGALPGHLIPARPRNRRGSQEPDDGNTLVGAILRPKRKTARASRPNLLRVGFGRERRSGSVRTAAPPDSATRLACAEGNRTSREAPGWDSSAVQSTGGSTVGRGCRVGPQVPPGTPCEPERHSAPPAPGKAATWKTVQFRARQFAEC
jgi:hypothetical protein